MRKLASIQKILNLEPIEKADFIEKATILGWECVVKKGEFNVGDLCVYFEIDSILPKHPHFDFMKDRKYRVKTIKLRKQISQGLALPISILFDFGINPNKAKEGDDVTKEIGVKKHDPFATSEAKRLKREEDNRSFILKYLLSFQIFRKFFWRIKRKNVTNFPKFIPQTDETRIQNIPQTIDERAGMIFYETEKLDGSSATFAVRKEKVFGPFSKEIFYVCSRKITRFKEDDSIWWRVARDFKVKERLAKTKNRFAVQGEIIGPGVQKNRYKLSSLEFYVFSVFDLKKERYLSLEEKYDFCRYTGFKHVPVLQDDLRWKKGTKVSFFVDKATVKSTIANHPMEGKVFRACHDDNISFKAINPKYLLKIGE